MSEQQNLAASHSGVHIDARGVTNSPITPALQKAKNDGLAQVIAICIVGIILVILTCTCAYVYIFTEKQTVGAALIGIIGTGLGYLMGGRGGKG